MNSIERYKAVLNRRKPDKIPFRVGNYNLFMTQYFNISAEDYITNPVLNAKILERMVNEFEIDSIKAGIGYILYGCGPEMGTTWDFPGNNFPVATKGCINEPEDIHQIQIHSAPQGYFKNFLEINKRAKAAIGDQTHLEVSVIGPFTVMTFLRGYEQLLMDSMVDPDFFSQQMKKGEEISLYIGKHCLSLNLHWINLAEVFINPGIMSPDFYFRHVEPHIESVCHKLGSPPITNTASWIMGQANSPKSSQEGKMAYDNYFGTSEAVDLNKDSSDIMLSGFPSLISVSGDALISWPTDQILSFIQKRLDHFINSKNKYPAINLPSIQAHNHEHAQQMAAKLRAIANYRNDYTL